MSLRILLLVTLSAVPAAAEDVTVKPLPVDTTHRFSTDELPPPFASESARKNPKVVDVPDDATLRVPEGFAVDVYAEGLDKPRWLALTPEGDVLVTETYKNRIRRLVDADGDGAIDETKDFLTEDDGLNIPFGMAFSDSHFFLGNTDAVLRFPYAKGDGIAGEGEKITDLPGGGYNQHWTRNVRVAPDGKRLFVTVGSKSNVDAEEPPRASVQVMDLDGSDRQTYASGLRNPVGLDFQPGSGDVYVTVNERDQLGDNLVPDYLTGVKRGGFYGWPYAYLKPENLDPRRMEDGKSERPDLAEKTLTPDVLFEPHSAALGMAFYDHDAFPQKYRGGAFVAFRGSWNRSAGTGYKLVFVPFEDGKPTGAYEDFVTGFLTRPEIPLTWGRPVGVLAHPDGSILFTEEMNGRIYRVRWTDEEAR